MKIHKTRKKAGWHKNERKCASKENKNKKCLREAAKTLQNTI